MLENIEKGSREFLYAQEGGRMVVRAEIGKGRIEEEQIEEERGSPPSSNPSDDVGGAGARLAGRSSQYAKGDQEAGARAAYITWGILRWVSHHGVSFKILFLRRSIGVGLVVVWH